MVRYHINTLFALQTPLEQRHQQGWQAKIQKKPIARDGKHFVYHVCWLDENFSSYHRTKDKKQYLREEFGKSTSAVRLMHELSHTFGQLSDVADVTDEQ